MPYRKVALLDTWLSEFASEHPLADLVRVVPLIGVDETDLGLVILPLGGGTTAVFIEPVAEGDQRWRVHFERRDQEAIMSSLQVHSMAAELEMVALLCDFLELKSAEHLATAVS